MNQTRCRLIVAARSRGVCEVCGQARASEMAHRLARSRMGRWTPGNILHTCNPCHAAQRNGKGGERLATRLGQVLPSMIDGQRPDPTKIPVSTVHGWVLLDDAGGVTSAVGAVMLT